MRWQWRSSGRRHGRTGSRRNDNNAQLAPLNLSQSRARSRPFVPDVRPWSLPLTNPRHLQLADPWGGRERSARHCPPGRPDRGEGLGRSVSASRAARSEWAGPYTSGHFRGPLWRFCEAVFTLDPSKSRIPRRGRSDATNAPQICELQVTGFRRPGRPRRGPPAGTAGQARDENVGTARGVKRARSAARRRGTFAADKKRGRPLGSERPCMDDPSTMPV